MDSTEKILKSYANLWSKYSTLMPEYEYTSVRDSLVFSPGLFLLVPHCLVICMATYNYTKGKQYFLKSIILTFFVGFGGATIASIFSAVPVPFATIVANELVPTMLCCWWLVHCIPAFRMFCELRIVSAVIVFLASFAKVRAITSTVERIAELVPGGWAASIIIGGIAGCGGMFFLDVDRKLRIGLDTRSTFSAPGWGFKSAFLVSAAYYVVVDFHGLIHPLIDIPEVDRPDLVFSLSLFAALVATLEVLTARSYNLFYYGERTIVVMLGLDRTTEVKNDTGKGTSTTDAQKKKNQ